MVLFNYKILKVCTPSSDFPPSNLKGLSHELDLENVDENGQILASTRAAAGF